MIKEISKKTKISEIYITRKILELANEMPEGSKQRHIGYFLISHGKKELYQKQKSELEKNQELIHKFVLKFDYRFHDMELGEAQTAVSDTIEKISGYIDKEI